MVPAAHTETKRAFEPNIEGSTSFCISAAVTKEFPKPDVVHSSLAASTPEDKAGEPNTSMDNPINVSMKGRIASDPIQQCLKSVPQEDLFYVAMFRHVSCFSSCQVGFFNVE